MCPVDISILDKTGSSPLEKDHIQLSINCFQIIDFLVLIKKKIEKYHEDVLDLEEGLLSGSFDRLAILCDVAFSSFLFDILARHKSLIKI